MMPVYNKQYTYVIITFNIITIIKNYLKTFLIEFMNHQ